MPNIKIFMGYGREELNYERNDERAYRVGHGSTADADSRQDMAKLILRAFAWQTMNFGQELATILKDPLADERRLMFALMGIDNLTAPAGSTEDNVTARAIRAAEAKIDALDAELSTMQRKLDTSLSARDQLQAERDDYARRLAATDGAYAKVAAERDDYAKVSEDCVRANVIIDEVARYVNAARDRHDLGRSEAWDILQILAGLASGISQPQMPDAATPSDHDQVITEYEADLEATRSRLHRIRRIVADEIVEIVDYDQAFLVEIIKIIDGPDDDTPDEADEVEKPTLGSTTGWYMGPTPWDADIRKMWHYECPAATEPGHDGEVTISDNIWMCAACGFQERVV